MYTIIRQQTHISCALIRNDLRFKCKNYFKSCKYGREWFENDGTVFWAQSFDIEWNVFHVNSKNIIQNLSFGFVCDTNFKPIPSSLFIAFSQAVFSSIFLSLPLSISTKKWWSLKQQEIHGCHFKFMANADSKTNIPKKAKKNFAYAN